MDKIFTWDDGSSVKDFRVTWSKMCEAAKVSILLHDFRRTAVLEHCEAGISNADGEAWRQG